MASSKQFSGPGDLLDTHELREIRAPPSKATTQPSSVALHPHNCTTETRNSFSDKSDRWCRSNSCRTIRSFHVLRLRRRRLVPMYRPGITKNPRLLHVRVVAPRLPCRAWPLNCMCCAFVACFCQVTSTPRSARPAKALLSPFNGPEDCDQPAGCWTSRAKSFFLDCLYPTLLSCIQTTGSPG
ncbi:hypothetical protein BD289DRAFT_41600 [Coniella lustricola]|uniref:Uncharacterized protein n=1 Tax=Coniella lustricola TaxID=2025994 RepID=A0A2T3A1X7_9PEZI|nr:hypothetical protein BD289DRAFT_41600 [Coniella lustricola]